MATVRLDIVPLAQRIVQYLQAVQRATNVRISELVPPPAKEVSFTLTFNWHGRERTFQYVLLQDGDIDPIFNTLRVETQGELLVQQFTFEDHQKLAPNIIYYPVRNPARA